MHGLSSRLRLSRIGLFFCLVVGVMLMMQVSVCAHPPSNVSMTYDKVSGVLTIIVDHNSTDLSLHNIIRLEIVINEGHPEDIVAYNWDETEDGVVATYNISVVDGDWIYAEAFCSVDGRLAGELLVGAQSDGSGESTPGFDSIVFLGAVMLFLIIHKRQISRT